MKKEGKSEIRVYMRKKTKSYPLSAHIFDLFTIKKSLNIFPKNPMIVYKKTKTGNLSISE